MAVRYGLKPLTPATTDVCQTFASGSHRLCMINGCIRPRGGGKVTHARENIIASPLEALDLLPEDRTGCLPLLTRLLLEDKQDRHKDTVFELAPIGEVSEAPAIGKAVQFHLLGSAG